MLKVPIASPSLAASIYEKDGERQVRYGWKAALAATTSPKPVERCLGHGSPECSRLI